MIKTTLKSIVDAKTTVQKLSEMTLPVKVSYGIAKLCRAMASELAVFNEERIKICEKYGKANEKENRYEFTPEGRANFDREYSELEAQEVELNVKPVKIPCNVSLTAQDLLTLEDFIEVDCDD